MLPFALLLLAFTLCNLCINRQGTLEDALSRGCTEGVKGFFILLVFFSHAIGYIKTSGYTFTSFELQLVEFVQETIGQLMVVMFLLYSGYGVHQSIMAKGREYIKGMPARRILPTLFNFDLAVLVFAIVAILLGKSISCRQFLLSLTGWKSIGNSNWYIFDILCLYGLAFLAFFVIKDFKKLTAPILLIILTLGFAFVLSRFKERWWSDTVLAFPAGVFLSHIKARLASALKKVESVVYGFPLLLICPIVLFSIICLSSNWFHNHPSIPIFLFFNLRACAFGLLCVLLTLKLSFHGGGLVWLGKHLFPIYIYQRLPMLLFSKGMIAASPALFLFTSLGATLAIAHFTEDFQNLMKKALQWLYLIPVKICVFLMNILWRRRYILFESYPTYTDSVKKVYDYMVAKGLGKKYGLIWVTYDKKKVDADIKVIDFMESPRKWRFYSRFAVACISSNRQLFIQPKKKGLSSFYITHGTSIKAMRGKYVLPKEIECMICASEGVKWLEAKELQFQEEKTVGLGLPRNDDLVGPHVDLQKLFNTNARKVVVWYPTFRQKTTMKFTETSSLPLIHDSELAKELNEYAKAHNILIVLKPHFAQDVSYITDYHLENILFINDEFFRENNISSYEFVGSCDGLITDYSSIMYDFTLCDKPIALIWEDIEEYRQNPGIAEGIADYLECAHKVYNMAELKAFLDIVISGNDPLEQRRQEVKVIVNQSTDASNTKRVAEYIIEKGCL